LVNSADIEIRASIVDIIGFRCADAADSMHENYHRRVWHCHRPSRLAKPPSSVRSAFGRSWI